MALSAGGFMVTAGLAIFLFAAWSTLSCESVQTGMDQSTVHVDLNKGVRPVADRDMLKLTQQEFEGVPILVKAEVLIASVVCMWGKQACHTLPGNHVDITVCCTCFG